MNQHFELLEDEEWDIYEEMRHLIKINPWAWQSLGAVSGLVGGVLSPVLGTLLIAVTRFTHSEGVASTLNGPIIVSFVLTVPLLAFGAHCLDLLERKAARLALIAEKRPEELDSTFARMRETRKDNRRRLKPTSMSIALAFLFVLPATGHTQQTIFNVPSTDVIDKGKVYVELDVRVRPNETRLSSFVPRVVGRYRSLSTFTTFL